MNQQELQQYEKERKIKELISQSLAMVNNYIDTGRNNKAIETLAQIKKIDPQNYVADALMLLILSNGQYDNPTLREAAFGLDWKGESLDDKSIEIFCDQGMGDTLNCLRYLKQMKHLWPTCEIHLNCFAFQNELWRFFNEFECINSFSSYHYEANYHTNILSLPTLMSGVQRDIYYPANWQSVLDKPIPESPIPSNITPKVVSEKAFRVGIAHKSNSDNPIGIKKSISLGCFAILEDGINELWSILPDSERCNMMIQPSLPDIFETAKLILGLDVVVSVDTVTLHLAGLLNKKTLGLLPYEADARWGLESTTVWYPSVELFRQPENGDWNVPMRQIKIRLESLRNML